MASEQVALPVSEPGSVTIFRYTDYDVPFWARPNTRPGRWHEVGDAPTQYWSMTPDAAWAELIRAKDLYTEQELDLVRMPLWVCRVALMNVVNLHDHDMLMRCGLTHEALVGDDWGPCQQAGPVLREQARGVIAPSAALDDDANLTIFGARRAIDWRTKPALASTLPAALVAVGGPPPGLIQRVRRKAGATPQAPLFEE